MSTSPDARAINALSRWLAGHLGDDELRLALERDAPQLAELREALRAGESRARLQLLVREALQELALG